MLQATIERASLEAKNLFLYIGENSHFVDSKLKEVNYLGYSFSTTEEVKQWLNNRWDGELPSAIFVESQIQGVSISDDVNFINLIKTCHTIPVILVGDSYRNSDRKIALIAGVDDYWSKAMAPGDMDFRLEYVRKTKTRLNSEVIDKSDEWRKFTKTGILKRLFDITVSLMLIVLLSPLLLLIALLVKLGSRGPVFYISKRAGKNYKVFNFIKFRSMYIDSDAKIDELKEQNQYAGSGKSVFIKIKNDPRVTPLGHLLRKTSMDELPQLFNVLIGDMSLVGNRPLPLYEAQQLTIDRACKRFLAPAGITGLWQVTKRGKDTMSPEERISLDILYARKQNFFWDLQILFKTFGALVQEEKV